VTEPSTPAPKRVLVNLAHPVLEKSRVNRRLVEAIRGVRGITVNDLYEEYPDLVIDVEREKALLVEHDIIVFQHPFYWYSTPSLLKEWQDLVLQHGWAYGDGGHALDGKITFNVVSTGGPQEAYRNEGHNRFTMRELLAPYDQTAHLCRMRYLPPFPVHAALKLETENDVAPYGARYARLLGAFRDGTVDLAKAETLATLDQLELA